MRTRFASFEAFGGVACAAAGAGAASEFQVSRVIFHSPLMRGKTVVYFPLVGGGGRGQYIANHLYYLEDMGQSFTKPTKDELKNAFGHSIPDLIRPDLKILFCGINPGLYSGATGLHFARPGNRFWPALHAAGFSKRLLAPWENEELLEAGYGVTNLVMRTTATAAELDDEEYRAGRRALMRKIRKYSPRWVAILGLGAYRTGFRKPEATIGRQVEKIGSSGLWVLPNPSGLNANYQLPQLARMFDELRLAAENPASN